MLSYMIMLFDVDSCNSGVKWINVPRALVYRSMRVAHRLRHVTARFLAARHVTARFVSPRRLLDSVLLQQFVARLSVYVKEREVVRYNGYGEHEQQDAGDGAQDADGVSERRTRHQVAVPDRTHRHDTPPEAGGDRAELVSAAVARRRPLGVVDERGEHEHCDEQEDGQHEQLVHAGADRVHEDAERAVVLDEVEHPEDAYDAQQEDRLDGDAVATLRRVVTPRRRHVEGELDVERQQRQRVDDVDGRAHEAGLVGGEGEADDQLDAEETRADDIQVVEGVARRGLGAVGLVSRPRRRPAQRQRLEAESGDGRDDEAE